MKRKNAGQLINGWVILGAFCVAILLMVLSLIGFGWTRPNPTEFGFQPADLTVIPGPTSTPNIPAAPTMDAALLGTPTPLPGTIAVNVYIQITGTEGEGLRFRSEPSLNGEPLFFGNDSEVFQVKDGPKQADGHTWWYLVAPYDENRAGWAVANYLAVIPPP